MKQIDQHLQDENTRLVRTVKKYPTLYDISAPEYSVKQHTQRCWDSVARDTGLSVQECRTRWRNLRISYLRYRRQAKSNSKKRTKPYYLNNEMSYMENFVRHSESKMEDISYKVEEEEGEDPSQIVFTIHKGAALTSGTEYTTEIVNVKDTQLVEQDLDAEEDTELDALAQSSTILEDNTQQQEQQQLQHHSHQQSQKEQAKSSHTEQLLNDLANPDLAFFRSIIPDMEAMNPSQKAKFKYSVMEALNSILYP